MNLAPLFEAPGSPFLVPFDGSFRITDAAASPAEEDRQQPKKRLRTAVARLDDLQRLLLANGTWSVLLVFQGMDAAGKDGTIRAVMSGVSPTGCEVSNFRRPTRTELKHDFLWRTARALPERGHIGIFNRSHYEEVLVVRVHPEILESQALPRAADEPDFWDERLQSIRAHEEHLARNGTLILKFWLNVSPEEQRRRFLSRLDDANKNWKFNADDVAERKHWGSYMQAYQEALNATSRPWAPWYAIPADSKPYMRAAVAETVVAALERLGLEYPRPSSLDLVAFEEARARLDEP